MPILDPEKIPLIAGVLLTFSSKFQKPYLGGFLFTQGGLLDDRWYIKNSYLTWTSLRTKTWLKISFSARVERTFTIMMRANYLMMYHERLGPNHIFVTTPHISAGPIVIQDFFIALKNQS